MHPDVASKEHCRSRFASLHILATLPRLLAAIIGDKAIFLPVINRFSTIVNGEKREEKALVPLLSLTGDTLEGLWYRIQEFVYRLCRNSQRTYTLGMPFWKLYGRVIAFWKFRREIRRLLCVPLRPAERDGRIVAHFSSRAPDEFVAW